MENCQFSKSWRYKFAFPIGWKYMTFHREIHDVDEESISGGLDNHKEVMKKYKP